MPLLPRSQRIAPAQLSHKSLALREIRMVNSREQKAIGATKPSIWFDHPACNRRSGRSAARIRAPALTGVLEWCYGAGGNFPDVTPARPSDANYDLALSGIGRRRYACALIAMATA